MSDATARLINRLKEFNKDRHDEIRAAPCIQLTEEYFTFEGTPIKTTQTAVRHMCAIARIPYEFFNRLTPSERSIVFNRLVSEMNDVEYKYRFSGTTLYAIVSKRYKIMDTIVILDIIREIRSAGFKLVPVKSILSFEHSKIRLVDRPMKQGQLFAMVELQNSETGDGSFQILSGVYRAKCSNGLSSPVNGGLRSKWIHAGGDKRISVPDIQSVLDSSYHYLTLMESSMSMYLSAERKTDLLLYIAKSLGPTVAEKVWETANKENQGTLYSLINSITAAAQTFSHRQQSTIEMFASTLLQRNNRPV